MEKKELISKPVQEVSASLSILFLMNGKKHGCSGGREMSQCTEAFCHMSLIKCVVIYPYRVVEKMVEK